MSRGCCRRSRRLKNGKRIACIGAGCASLTVANDLMPLGYEVTIFEQYGEPGGLMRTNIPSFRLPQTVLNEEIAMITGMGVDLKLNTPVKSMRELLEEGGFDAVFVGSGAPKGKELKLPGREAAAANVHIGIAWLESVAFGHIEKIGKRVLIIGVGNTAMDCCRTSLRLGADSVKVMARKPRGFFKASEWELEDAEEESVEIIVNRSPKAFVIENGRLTGMRFDKMEYELDASGQHHRRAHRRRGVPARGRCDPRHRPGERLPVDRARSGDQFDKWDVPVIDKTTFQSTRPGGVLRRRCGLRAEEHHLGGGARAPGRHLHSPPLPRASPVSERLAPRHQPAEPQDGHARVVLLQRLHARRAAADAARLDSRSASRSSTSRSSWASRAEQVEQEVQRCLNCDVQTVFVAKLCIECDACIDICPVDCLTITHNGDGG